MGRNKSGEILSFLYEKLSDVISVERALLASWGHESNFDNSPELHVCVKLLSLANGLLGPVLFYSIFSKVERRESTDKIIFNYLKRVKTLIESNDISLNISMFSGMGALSFTVAMASEGKKYQTLLANLNNSLLNDVQKVIGHIEITLSKNEAVSSLNYDCVQGICGTIRYLLENASTVNNGVNLTIKRGLAVLIRLSQEDSEGFLRCYLNKDDPLNTSYPKDETPPAMFNLGLAHGVPGILSTLASAMMKGIVLPQQAETISSLSQWLWRQSLVCAGHVRWPYSIVSTDKNRGLRLQEAKPSREAWCYGSPGILRALFLGAKALKDENAQLECLDHFLRIFDLSKEDMQIYDYSICHGLSGLYLITKEMHKDTNHPALHEQLNRMYNTIINNFDPSLPFGFCSTSSSDHNKKIMDFNTGLLEGCVGIGLTVLSEETNSSEWYLPLLIN